MTLGLHWIATGRAHRAADVARLLRDLPDALGLTRIGEPVLSGTSGVVLLSESHASAHVDESGAFLVDVFSCRAFDVAAARRVLDAALAPSDVEERVLERRADGPPVADPGPPQGLCTHEGRLVVTESWPDGYHRKVDVERVVFEQTSDFQRVLVVDTPAAGRMLLLDEVIQSASADEAAYHEALVQPAMHAHPSPRRVLVAGGGEGATAREVLRHPSVERVRMVDIDRVVVGATRAHMGGFGAGAWDDPRLEVVHDDFFAFVRETRGWDVIVVDLTDELLNEMEEMVFHLRDALAPGGVVAVQIGELEVANPEGYAEAVAAMREAFPGAAPYARWMASYACFWGFVISRPPVGLPLWETLSFLPDRVREALDVG